MLKVWGRKTSSNVQKVMWAIGDLGLAHERVDIGGSFGGNKEPPYLAMNPNGLVPTLEDGDVMLWESNTIVRYLGARYAAGDDFSMGDIPVGIMVYRFRQLVPDRPPLPNLERWYAQIEKRPGFRDHVAAVPLT